MEVFLGSWMLESFGGDVEALAAAAGVPKETMQLAHKNKTTQDRIRMEFAKEDEGGYSSKLIGKAQLQHREYEKFAFTPGQSAEVDLPSGDTATVAVKLEGGRMVHTRNSASGEVTTTYYISDGKLHQIVKFKDHKFSQVWAKA